MITLTQLTDAQRHIYWKIVQKPVSTDLRRADVRSILEKLGEVEDRADDTLKVTRNGHVLKLPARGEQDLEEQDELTALQHFLKRSENPLQSSNGREAHLLLVIGHHQARLFRSEIYGGHPHQLPLDGEHNRFALAAPARERTATNDGTEEDDAFFGPIARALQCSGKILVFGESSATQVEMDHFIVWLKRRHPDLARRIVGSLVLEKDQAGSGPLLQRARDFYAHELTV